MIVSIILYYFIIFVFLQHIIITRFFLDFFEEVTLIPANLILVNSNFTKGFFYDSFPILKKLKVKTEVLYPCIDLNKFKKTAELLNVKPSEFTVKEPFFLSLNRYERKKNIGLAIKAFGELRKNCEGAQSKDYYYFFCFVGDYYGLDRLTAYFFPCLIQAMVLLNSFIFVILYSYSNIVYYFTWLTPYL